MAINCCRYCVAPKRYPGCHDHCPEYLAQKIIHDAMKDAEDKRTAVKNGIYGQRETALIKAFGKRRFYSGIK